MLAILQELAKQSNFNIQNALHPENLASQHVYPIRSLHKKYKVMLDILADPTQNSRLMDQLNEEEMQALSATRDVINTEKSLLWFAIPYASTFPRG